MKKPNALLLVSVFSLIACDTYKPHNLLSNPSFEELDEKQKAIGWLTGQHYGDVAYKMKPDITVSSHGKNSFKIEQFKDQVYGIVDQDVLLPKRKNSKFKFTAMLKTKDVAKGDGWRLVINLKESDGYIIKQLQSEAIIGTTDWQKVSITAELPEKTSNVVLGAMMQSMGTGWIDEAELIVE